MDARVHSSQCSLLGLTILMGQEHTNGHVFLQAVGARDNRAASTGVKPVGSTITFFLPFFFSYIYIRDIYKKAGGWNAKTISRGQYD